MKAAVYIIALLVAEAVSNAFPLEQFQAFINTKATVEQFIFELATAKDTIQNLEPGQYRKFRAICNTDATVFALIEDTSHLRGISEDSMDAARNVGSGQKWPIPVNGYFWIRHYDNFWSRFNSNDVHLIDVKSSTEREEAAVAFRSHFGMVFDALNFGIVDLFTNKLTWRGNRFKGASTAPGVEINGELVVEGGTPTGMNLTYSSGKSVALSLKVTYEFQQGMDLPEFFPSRIRVQAGSLGGGLADLCDYKVLSAALSRRVLKRADVDYTVLAPPVDRSFVSANGETMLVLSNRSVRVLKPGESPDGHKHRPRAMAFLALLLVTGMLVIMVRLKRRRQ